ncbi:MAG: hypothetical protein JSR82_20495 [Verrucomicrobia bacterium]|nr:hypothetical protein [Verrucomicrobiota bacterium]
MSDHAAPSTLWPQVICLGLVNASLGLAWLAYQLYLPSLLTSLGLAAGFAATLLFVEALLAIVLEPAFGLGSDATFRRAGTRWPLILLGCLLSAAILFAIPALLLEPAQRDARLRLLALGLLVAWAMAMTACRTPVLALLARYSTPAALPQAAAVLTCFTAAVAALRPGAKDFILGFGPTLCFFLASLLMVGTTILLQFIDGAAEPPVPEPVDPFPSSAASLGALALAGAALGVAQKAALGEVLPRALGLAFEPGLRDRLLVGLFVLLALTALGSGALARRLGNNRVMLFGAALAGAELLLLAQMKSPALIVATAAVFVLLFAGAVNGAFPFVFARVPHGRGGLGLGFWFGGLAAGSAAFSWFLPNPAALSLAQLSQVGFGALVVLAAVVLQTSRAR